ncbi:acid protease [Saccharata proteae CBS 121410]|uniref:Acid protease n=1 Tax=Saccharata proteae CBS 121410 TaxID=1314787 RepID=A0A9P4HYC0_9PEZI|nr:acid protease [Saccharata proteae CBS 121410]
MRVHFEKCGEGLQALKANPWRFPAQYLRFAHFSFLLLPFSLNVARVIADCLPQPLVAPITNVKVSKNGTMRGIDMKVGSPAQSFAFEPRWEINNTFVYNGSAHCTSDSDEWCETHHGGWYDESASSSFVSADSVTAAGGNSYDPNATEWGVNWATDDFTVATNITLPSFPIGIPTQNIGDNDYAPQAILGVNSGSTLLSSLKFAGHIGARVWSIFWGLTGATSSTQMDGNFVLGGYDAAKVQGSPYNFTFNSDPACAYLVTISDISMNFPNGSDFSLFDGSQSDVMQACISTSFPVLMTLKYDYYTKFETYAGVTCEDRSVGVNFYGMLCALDQLYDGALTISFQNGLSVRVPNDQLLIPNQYIDQNGYLQTNDSVRELIINSIQEENDDDLPVLGRQFFSAAYMMSNLDANQFSLWAANPTTDTDLVAVDSKGNSGSTTCEESAVASNSSTNSDSATGTSTAVPTTSVRSTTSFNLSAGAIAGIVIGAIGALGIVGGLILFGLCRHSRQSGSGPPPQYSNEYLMTEKPPTPPYSFKVQNGWRMSAVLHPRSYDEKL